MSTFRLYFRALFPEKYAVKDHISNTKLERKKKGKKVYRFCRNLGLFRYKQGRHTGG